MQDMLKAPTYINKQGKGCVVDVSPMAALGSYISWSAQYGIPVFFTGTREFAERTTFRFLAAYLKHMAGISPLYGVDSTMRRGAGEGAVTKRRGTRGRPGSKRKLSHRRFKCPTRRKMRLILSKRVLRERLRVRKIQRMFARIAAEEW